MPNNVIRSIPDQQCQLLTTSVHDDADDEDDYDYIIIMMMMIMVMMLTTASTMTMLMSMMMVTMMKKMRMIMSTMTVLMSMMMVMMMKKKKMPMITSTMTALMRMMMVMMVVMMMMLLMMMNSMNEGASRAQASPAITCTSEPKSRAQARRLPPNGMCQKAQKEFGAQGSELTYGISRNINHGDNQPKHTQTISPWSPWSADNI